MRDNIEKMGLVVDDVSVELVAQYKIELEGIVLKKVQEMLARFEAVDGFENAVTNIEGL